MNVNGHYRVLNTMNWWKMLYHQNLELLVFQMMLGIANIIQSEVYFRMFFESHNKGIFICPNLKKSNKTKQLNIQGWFLPYHLRMLGLIVENTERISDSDFRSIQRAYTSQMIQTLLTLVQTKKRIFTFSNTLTTQNQEGALKRHLSLQDLSAFWPTWAKMGCW